MTLMERFKMYAQRKPEMVFGIVFVMLFTVTSLLITKPFYGKQDILPELTEETFAQMIGESDKPVIIEFFAPWCGPCKVQGAILSEYQMQNPDTVTIAKVNIDKNQDLAAKYHIKAIPTIILFKNGSAANRATGINETKKIEEMLAQN